VIINVALCKVSRVWLKICQVLVLILADSYVQICHSQQAFGTRYEKLKQADPCIVTAFSELFRRTVKVKTRVHSKPGTRSGLPRRHQLTLQIWCAQQRLIASRLRQETLHWLRSERSAFLYIPLSRKKHIRSKQVNR